MNCRTLISTPTNVAISEITTRLVKQVLVLNRYSKYGLGNLVMLSSRNEVGDCLFDVLLSHRIDVLNQLFDPKTGWSSSLSSLIHFLEDFRGAYASYLREKDPKQEVSGKKVKMQNSINIGKSSFSEFSKKKFSQLSKEVEYCLENSQIHLPTSILSSTLVKCMSKALKWLARLKRFMGESDGTIEKVFKYGTDEGGHFAEIDATRWKCISLLKSLSSFDIGDMNAEQFALKNTTMVFCTVSNASKLKNAGGFEVLIVDEAAQLKECEASIPLQVPGISHVLLIGDDKQLLSLVKSKISNEAAFGRSLFERLASIGHKKYLLNLQHRMHPSISSFPNRYFYNNQILDAENVKAEKYSKALGELYGTYSFINVTQGRDEQDNKKSSKNIVEAAVVTDIITRIYKEFKARKEKVHVGVISPYKAQVDFMSKKIEKLPQAPEQVSLTVGSIDGFQGSEADIVIISTVLSTKGRSVEFISRPERVNVAITRARFCLWIVGDGDTLSKCESIWKSLVLDAKERKLFYNAVEDTNLAHSIFAGRVELNLRNEMIEHSLLFRAPDIKWVVRWTNAFWLSMTRIRDYQLIKKVLGFLVKLSTGWRGEGEIDVKKTTVVHMGYPVPVEFYKIDEKIFLVWGVEILTERSCLTQILKIWDILRPSETSKIERDVKTFYRSYALEEMSFCASIRREGNLVLPMKWQ